MREIITVAYMFISFFSFNGFVEGNATYIAPLQTATVCEIMEETKEYNNIKESVVEGIKVNYHFETIDEEYEWEIENGFYVEERSFYNKTLDTDSNL